MDRNRLQQLSAWMGFVGVITIIGGIISAIAGLFALVVGAIPGIIAIVLGIKLLNAKKNADEMLLEYTDQADSVSFNMLIANLGSYFKIQGILTIISILFALLGLFFCVLFGYGVYSGMFF